MSIVPDQAGASGHDLNLLAAYVEGRLEAAERARVIDHLAACAECRGVLAELSRNPVVREAATGHRPRWSQAVWLPLAAAVILATLVGRTMIGLRTGPVASPTTSSASAAPSPSPAAGPSPTVSRSPGPSPGVEGRDVPSLLTRRGVISRSTGGKTFRFVSGEWVDMAFDPDAGAPVVEVRSPGERAALLERLPVLAPFAALGPRVVVVFEGTVYRLRSPGSP